MLLAFPCGPVEVGRGGVMETSVAGIKQDPLRIDNHGLDRRASIVFGLGFSA